LFHGACRRPRATLTGNLGSMIRLTRGFGGRKTNLK
jgi:hypothetical protein